MLCVPRKTVQILKCLRLYKPLLHTIFSVYFEMFTLNHYKMTVFFSIYDPSVQTQICVCACTMFIDLMTFSSVVVPFKERERKKAIKTTEPTEGISNCT